MGFKKNEIPVPGALSGYPCIAGLDRNNCLIADSSGHLSLFNLVDLEFSSRVYVGLKESACQALRSLCVGPRESRMAAVAARCAYASVLDLNSRTARRVFPETGGPVNAVSFSPQEKLLTIGTGYYSPPDDKPSAKVELWSLEGETPAYLGCTALPGVCVDAMAWDADGREFAVATGGRSQNRGWLVRIDASTLRPLAFFEMDWVNTRRLAYLDLDEPASHLAVVGAGSMSVLSCYEGRKLWKIEPNETLMDFSYDPGGDSIALSNGVIVDAADGSMIDRLEPMVDCTAIAHRPGGGYLGVSSKGRLCWWE